MENKPNYYSIIPANIRYDEDLTANAKLLYAEITSLTQMNGRCNASSNYFANLYGVTKTAVQKWLKSLEDKNYIHREVEYEKGSKQILSRYITIVNHPTQQMLTTPTQQMLRDNNTTKVEKNNNITYSNKPDVLTLDMKFSEFFLEYGNPIKRGLALLEFKKLTSKDINEILKVVKSESFKDYSKEKGKYMQEPHNWLKAQGWLDDYSTPSNEETKEPEKDYAKIDEIAAKYFGDEMVKRFGYKKLKAWSMGGMFADNGMSQGETHEVCKQVEKELKEKGLI